MLAVLKKRSAPGFSLEEIPEPEPKEDEVLVEVVRVSICGTDVGIVNWSEWAMAHVRTPVVLGHEIVGRVLKLPAEYRGNIQKGDLVSSETHIFCGKCATCLAGARHICEQMELFGISRNGSFAQKATIPVRTTWKNDPAITLDFMSVQEPLGNAVHTVTEAEVGGKGVLVVGLGPVGLCAGVVAKFLGATKIVGIDPSKYRRKLGENLGFDEVLDPSTPSTALRIEYERVLEMSGTQAGIEIAGEAVRPGGKIMAFGLPKNKIVVEWGKYFIDKETTVQGVFGRHIWETWEQVTKILKSGKIDLSPLITHRFRLESFGEAIDVMKSGECGKILLEIGKV